MNRRRDERGAAMVEFALMTPLLFLVLFGLIDMGRMFLVQAMVTNGAREGARMASLRMVGTDLTTRVNTSMPSLDTLSGGTHTITVTQCPTTFTPTSAASVTVSTNGFDWVALGAVASLFPGGAIAPPTPAATSSMRCAG